MPYPTNLAYAQLERCSAYAELIAGADLPLLPFPNLHFYVQSDPSTRTNVDTDPQYAGIRDLSRTLLSHLAGSIHALLELLHILLTITTSAGAKEALEIRLGSRKDPGINDVEGFLLDHTPDIIFRDIIGQGIIWGEVLKGEEEGADRNEVAISMELLRALRDPPPPTLSPEQSQTQALQHRLLLCVTLLREVTDCMTKFFFGQGFITPPLPRFERDPRGGGAGLTFEKRYVGFVIELLWRKEDVEQDGRLWYVENVVTRLGFTQTRILSFTDILKILTSFRKKTIWLVESGDLSIVPGTVNENSHVRRRGGAPVPMVLEEEEDPFTEQNGYVRSSWRCPPRGLGRSLGP
ncbi:hypothetical protein B0H11DRAFT_2303034 [Mycena galericulata]|nr:hypothetical protein B0H11DRAFT_2303034 [Mycena galericulata]